MADPKYAELPGIAYDEPDVYETNNLPESEQDYNEIEAGDSCPSIEVLHISASDAHKRFKGKILDSTHVDFSDQISSKRKNGYATRRVEWDIGTDEGEDENLVQKYQRLQVEVNQLMQEIQQVKDTDISHGDGKVSVPDLCKQVEVLHNTMLNLSLEETLGQDVVSSISEPQLALQKKVVTLLESLRKVGFVSEKNDKYKPEEKKLSIKEDESPSTVTYQLYYTPEHAKLNHLAKASELEKRLDKLESLIGNNPDKMSSLCAWTNHKDIRSAVQVLSSRMSLLEPHHLDEIEGRLHAIHTKMNNIAEKKAPIADAEKQTKITELYDIMKKCEVLASGLPDIVTRLACTEGIHQEALQFSRSLKQLDVAQTQLSALLQTNTQLLSDVQDKFLSNLDTIQTRISALDTRVDKLNK